VTEQLIRTLTIVNNANICQLLSLHIKVQAIMPVTTVSADQITWINSRPTLAADPNTNTKPPHKKIRKTHVVRHHKPINCRAEQPTPLSSLVTPGSPVAVDCEGVYLFSNTGKHRCGVGRISIVDTNGQVIYDTFVYCPKYVPHGLPPRHLKLGVTKADIKPENGAQPHARVLAAAKAIFDKSGIVVAHSANSDKQMLAGIDFDGYVVRDTQKLYSASSGSLQPSLSSLATDVLGRSIQVEEHSSVEDARATMELFLLHHDEHKADCDHTGEPLKEVAASSPNVDSTSAVPTDSGAGGLSSDMAASRRTRITSLLSSASSEFAPGHPLAESRVFNRELAMDI
jgi:hypothetical protein